MVSAALKAMVTMESFTRCKGRGWGSCCVDVRQDESFPPTLKMLLVHLCVVISVTDVLNL